MDGWKRSVTKKGITRKQSWRSSDRCGLQSKCGK